ncbi:hypothetical protein CNMCM6805_003533 [Aspergillus fumigatiaffinis]|uniref:Flavin-containing monooxygenase n=1 Tax=Aspergillus fumigatiaffinis TaxID=340414 RepID=A0A8H4HBM4_9EURO|nr:hypothetical protein CNMCM5878_005319 [Aspergillus fumigatiaffinis]KAF4239721.1 hypothetical protein CNMCM6457_008641 [Aspergillus fumigatiaffinis]KAF4245589.1 hypothetical protein CNMCM6805_003533 [Aspergillus fumigatiaffinis]
MVSGGSTPYYSDLYHERVPSISGLATAKQCLAERFSVTVFEAHDNIGGQWYYEEPDPATSEVQSSMPIPGFLRPSGFHAVSHDYADYFGLKEHILFNTRVVSCQQVEDNRWKIKYTTEQEKPTETVYDALLVCSGKSTKPHIPTFRGMEEGFSGKRVAIIGFGNLAADVASEICGQTEECHLVTRRGGPVLAIGAPGVHLEMVPDNTRPARGGKIVTTGDDILGANPAIHSSLIENIKVGRITPHRASVGEITATGLSLTNGETIDNLDAIILCTGYDIDYPFISDNCYCSKHSKFMDSRNSVHLYRLTVPHVRNLFIMGVFQLPGPIQPAVELQARWVTAILTGRIMLPPAGRMSELIASEEEEGGRQWIHSDRHTVFAHFLPYCDSLANDLGAAPIFRRRLLRIFTSNPIE